MLLQSPHPDQAPSMQLTQSLSLLVGLSLADTPVHGWLPRASSTPPCKATATVPANMLFKSSCVQPTCPAAAQGSLGSHSNKASSLGAAGAQSSLPPEL